jgi:hypothetical protein
MQRALASVCKAEVGRHMVRPECSVCA